MKKINLLLTIVTIIFLLQNILIAQIEKFPDLKFLGEEAGNNFGFSATDAGDVNGDGYDDILVGAPYFNSNTGRAYIFFGSQNMDNIPDIILNGQSTENFFGKSVSTAGDVNDDGFYDILVSKLGSTFIYFGSSNFDSNPDLTLIGTSTPGPLADVSDAGDVNNDGFDDVLIGVNNSNYAVIYLGGANMDNTYDVYLQNGSGKFGFCVSSAGDFNNDGFGDVIIGEHTANATNGRANIFYGGINMDNVLDLVFNGELNGSIFGHSVSDAGDVNGDGFDDIVVGAPYYTSNLGKTFIYFGGTNPDNVSDVILQGQLLNSHFGHTVSKAGDFNRDGFDDIIVGSISYNNLGRIDIYFGGVNMNTIPDLYMLGNNDQLGFEVSTAGDVNGDGKTDILASARTNDIAGTDAGIVYLFHNSLNNFIVNIIPDQNEINFSKSSDISVAFSQEMNASTINSSKIKVFGHQTGLKSTSVSYNAGTRTATINPNSDFKVGEKIQVTLSSGIKTSSSIPITPFTWTFTVQALGGTGVFTETIIDTAGSGNGGIDILSGDFNGDNKNDIAAINYSGDTYIYTNNGNAGFSVTQVISVSGLSVGGGLTSGDFDGDGDLDLFMSFYNPSEHFYVYMNDGNGHFTQTSSGTPGIYYCETADLDNDGDLDVVGMWYGTELRYLINDGAGNFTPHSIPGKDFSREICDVENDGDLDIICANGVIGSATGINVLVNDGNANFSVGNTSVGSSIVWYASAQDYDSDGDIDIVSNGAIFLNDGSGNFNFSASPGTGFTLTSGDFDADGDIDNAFSENTLDKTTVFKNNSSAIFTNSQNVSVGDSPGWSSSCDFDEDGDIDIAVGNYLGHTGQSDISILINNLDSCYTPECNITGADTVITGSTNLIYLGSTQNAYWEISNFDITGASILPGQSGDTVKISAGQNGGHFVLYYVTPVCGTYPSCSKHIYVVNPNAITCTIYSIMEGFYNEGMNNLSNRDTVRAYLRNVNAPYNLVDSSKAVIDSVLFGGSFAFLNAPTGTYYLVLKHRNGLITWSESGGVSLTKGGLDYYDFTSDQANAYGNNLTLKGTKYCVYSGDVNQNGIIDLTDLVLIYNDVSTFASGYLNSDLNGDRVADLSDMLIGYNNSSNFVSLKRP